MSKAICLGLVSVMCTMPMFATAGAWPRGKGNVFASSSAAFTWPDGRAIELPDIYGSAYFEYGLSSRITLGMDVGSSDATRSDRLKSVIFARYTLTQENASYQLALDGGVGRYLGQDVLRIGASFGKGFTSFGQQSWISIEAHSLRHIRSPLYASSIDATYGVTLRRGKIMGQFSVHHGFDHAQSMRFTPSFALDIGKGRHLEIGARFDMSATPDPAIKIGIWQEF